MREPTWPRPEISPDSIGYWNALSEGRLELSRCAGCGSAFHYPRPLCPRCGSWDVARFDASGAGTVYSFTVVHRAPSADLRPATPYVIALVDTDEGARLLTGIRGIDPDGVFIGQRVRVSLEDRGDVTVPMFEPAGT